MTWLKQTEEITGITNFLDFFTKYDLNPNNTRELISMIYKVPFNKWSIGSFTRDTSAASGTQAVTGVGFTPKILLFLANVSDTIQVCIGFSDGITEKSITCKTSSSAWINSSLAIYLFESAGVYISGVVQSKDSDGFTMNWTKTGSKTGIANIHYLALR